MNIEAINEERKKLKLSVKELADRAKLPQSTVEKILFGVVKNPRIDTVQAIERALGLSPSTFTEEDYANGVTDKVKLTVDTEQYEWLELRDEIIENKGKEYYSAVCDMLKAAIKQK